MRRCVLTVIPVTLAVVLCAAPSRAEIGREVAVPRHLADGEEFLISTHDLIDHGRLVFDAMWTDQEGGGRPLTKGNGQPLADSGSPLLFPRNFNRVSAPDANSCAGCHNMPRSGGGGDIVANVFVLGQRFDFAEFDPADTIATRSGVDESGQVPMLSDIANSRATLGMFGAGYIEMLARQMTSDLQTIAAGMAPGQTQALVSKGVSFGSLTRRVDGTWDSTGVEGLPASSIASTGTTAPNLIIKPFHQAGAVISLREFSNNAYNHHHGIQSTERFGAAVDPDGDGHMDELTRADVTAATIYQATLAVPGRVIPRHRPTEEAILLGEALFEQIGCASCHVSALPLTDWGWIFTEPNPFNPPGNLKVGEAPTLEIDLSRPGLPGPRLPVENGVTWVPAYTDLKLHDITSGPDDPNRESLDMHQPAGSAAFFAGNSRFLTKKLWGAANEPPYFHHGKFTTMRQAIEAHAGEAQATTDAWTALSDYERDSIIEFLKTLQVLPPGTQALIVDDKGHPRQWPPAWAN